MLLLWVDVLSTKQLSAYAKSGFCFLIFVLFCRDKYLWKKLFMHWSITVNEHPKKWKRFGYDIISEERTSTYFRQKDWTTNEIQKCSDKMNKQQWIGKVFFLYFWNRKWLTLAYTYTLNRNRIRKFRLRHFWTKTSDNAHFFCIT